MTYPTQPSAVKLRQELDDIVGKHKWVTSNRERLTFLERNDMQSTPIIIRYFSILRQLLPKEVPAVSRADYLSARDSELFAELGLGEHKITYENITTNNP